MGKQNFIKVEAVDVYDVELDENKLYWQVDGTDDYIMDADGNILQLKPQYTEEQRKIMNQKKRNNNKRYFSFYANRMDYLKSIFTDFEIFYLFEIAKKVDFHMNHEGDFIPLLKSQKNKTIMTDAEIRKLVKLDKSNQKQTWHNLKNKAVDYGIWAEVDGCIGVNKNFFFKGNYPKKLEGDVIMVKAYVEINNKLSKQQQKAIGTMLTLTQWLNSTNNSLVKNPHETNPDKLEYFKSVNELCKVTGINRRAFDNLWKTEIDNSYLVGIWKTFGGQKIVLNFNILFRSNQIKIMDNLKENHVDIDKLFLR